MSVCIDFLKTWPCAANNSSKPYLFQAWCNWCHHNAELVERATALRGLKFLVGSGGLDFTKGMDSLDKHLQKPLFGSESHFPNTDIWKPGHHTSNPPWLKTQSRQFFIAASVLFHGNMVPTLLYATRNGLGDHKPKNLIETWVPHAWVSWIERGQQIWVQKIHRQKSFESITDSQLKHGLWRCSSWIATANSTIHPCGLSDLLMSWISLQTGIAGMDALDKHVGQISLRQCVTFSKHVQLKGLPSEKSNRNFTATCMSFLDRARTANLGTENSQAKIIRIHHWFPTQTSTLTKFEPGCDSQLSFNRADSLIYSWVECLCKKEWQEWILKTNMPKKYLCGSASHFANVGSWKAGRPASKSLLLKAQSRQSLIGLQQSHVTTESTINILQSKSWTQSLYCT